jgi:IS605 OrfB family transposase
VETEARLFGAAVRTAYRRLADGLTRAARATPGLAKAVETVAERASSLRLELKRHLQIAFGLNSRYADDAILGAQEIIASQRARIPVGIAETEAKRLRTERKRKANQRKAERLREAGREAEAAAMEWALHGQQLRLSKLEAKLAIYRRHQAEGTIPAVVFGGRRLWRRLCRSSGAEHRRLRAEWHAARQGRLYSRGDARKAGNPNLRITLGQDGGFVLSAAISHLSEKTGHSVYVRQGKPQERDTYSEAPRVNGRLWVPRKHEALIWDLVLSGRPYAVEVLRAADGRWRAHVSFTPVAAEPVGGTDRGVVGIDLNPHGVAVANVGRDGNPGAWPAGLAERLQAEAEASLHKYTGEVEVGAAPGRMWLHVPEMWQADTARRGYLVGVVAKLAVDAALAVGNPLVHEDLDFAKEHDTNRVFNRYSSNFPYAELTEAVDRRARRFGVPVLLVDPAYTSAEGRWRFAPALGWSVHAAAALCIGRKAVGYRRRFPQRMRERLERVRQALVTGAGRRTDEATRLATREKGSPREGRARLIVAACKRIGTILGEARLLRSGAIGEKDLDMLRSRDFPRWRKRHGERDGPWAALVALQRARWGTGAVRGVSRKPVGGPNRPPGTREGAVARDRADSGNGRGPCEGSPVRVEVPACGVRERPVARVRLSPTAPQGANLGRKGRNPGLADGVEDRTGGLYTFF